MKNIFRYGILAVGLLFCLGCGGGEPPSTEKETEELYNSAEYEKEMLGETGGTGEKAE